VCVPGDRIDHDGEGQVQSPRHNFVHDFV
jgi:hypothetical protein